MNAHHLGYVLRQYIEHKHPANLRLHVGLNSIGWIAITTLLSQVPMPVAVPLLGANLGAWFVAFSVVYWAPADLAVSLLAWVWAVAWAHLPFAPWGPMGGHGWLDGVVAPLLTFIVTGLTALFAHVYYHEQCSFMANEPPVENVLRTTHAVVWGFQHFWLEYLLTLGYRPALRAQLDAAERQAILRRRGVPWTAWGRTASSSPAVVCVPQRTQDVVDAVVEARAAGRKLRVVGSGFTWSAFSATDDYLLFTERLDAVEVDLSDPAQPAVWVGGGANNRQLNAELARHGLTMPYNVVLETVRVAALVSTGTHGSGRDTATLSDLVLALEVVTADGTVRVLSAETLGVEGMQAARMSFGLFGVITRVRMAVVPAFHVRQVDTMCEEDELLARLPTLVALHDSVELYWLPYTDRVWLRTLDRAAGPAGRLGFGFLSTNFFQMFAFIGVIRALAQRWPWLASPLLRVGSRFLVFQEQTLTQADAQHYRRWVELVRCRCVEVAFKTGPALEEAIEAWRDTRRLVAEHVAAGDYPINIAVNLRFVGPSDALLSPAYGPGMTAFIEALAVHGTPGWPAFARELAGAWLRHPGALPHWAKELDPIPELEALAAERMGDRPLRFQAALAAAGVDPDGQFANPLTRRLGWSVAG